MQTDEVLDLKVQDFELSLRASKSLQRANIVTLRDLTKKTETELLELKNCGQTTVNELKKLLAGYKLSLRDKDIPLATDNNLTNRQYIVLCKKLLLYVATSGEGTVTENIQAIAKKISYPANVLDEVVKQLIQQQDN